MKRRNLFFFALALALLPGCRKEVPAPAPVPAYPMVEVTFDAAPPEVQTKVSHSLDPGNDAAHVLQWKKGDQISLMGYSGYGNPDQHTLYNFSSNRFTLQGETGSSKFSGYFPDFATIYDYAGTGTRRYVRLWGIHPAVTMTVLKENVPSSATKVFAPESAFSIPAVQDGSGWPYCVFFTNTPTNFYIDSQYMSPQCKNNPAFSLGNCVLRLKIKSGKDITRITLSKAGDGESYLVGDIVRVEARSTGTPALLLSDGDGLVNCPETTLTVENGGVLVNAGAEEYADVYLSVRALQASVPYYFTFTASDGTTCTKKLVPSSLYGPGVHSLGTMTLSSWLVSEPASVAIAGMGMGVSVGGFDNYEATSETIADRKDPETGLHYLDRSDPVTYETNGSKDRITQTTMNALKAAGFSTVRIPVTWWPHMGAPLSEDGVIDAVWLSHIQSVVDLARNAGMYVILNMHFDAGSAADRWLKADWDNYADISSRLKSMWRQIATHFKNYDGHLLFEGYNEITDASGKWFTPTDDSGYEAANALNQDFVDAVRASGGYNTVRNLICSTYTASDVAEAMQGFEMPSDILPGRIFVQIHSYRPIPFVTARTVGDNSRMEFYESDKAEIDGIFDTIQAGILDKGWPCILGEYGAFYKKSAEGNRNELGRAEHAYYYTTRALQKGIVPVYWYNPMDYRDRDDGRWTFPVMAQGLKDAWTDYQSGTVVYKKYDHDAAYPIL